MRQREIYFDAVKALLILLVVCCHAVEIGSRSTDLGRTIHFFINLFVIPVFLFIQGYLSKSTAVSDQKILGRILFYFALLCIGKILYYGGYLLIDGAFPPWTGETFWHEGSVPWYMLSSMFFTGSLWLARQLKGKPLIIFCVAIGIAAGCFSQIGVWFSLSRTLVFLPFYFAGYYFPKSWMEKLIVWKNQKGWKLAGGAVVGLVVVFLVLQMLLAKIPIIYDVGISLLWGNTGYINLELSMSQGCLWRAVCYLASFISGSMLLLAVPARSGSIRADWMASRVGSNTLPVYLLHYPVLLLLWRKVFPPEIPVLFLMVVCMALTLVLVVPSLSKPIIWLQTKTLELASSNQESV